MVGDEARPADRLSLDASIVSGIGSFIGATTLASNGTAMAA
jgi:hypothetical protein